MDDLELIKKREVVNRDGVSYADFRTQLTPRYWMVWRDIAVAYLGIGVVIASSVALQLWSPAVSLLAIPALSILLGYAIASLMLFFHEAAHYNIAPNRRANDILANLFIGLITGQDIANYRVIHWGHHRHLGDTDDTEFTYFSPLNARFIVESLTGIKALRVALSRKKSLTQGKNGQRAKRSPMLLLGLLGNLTVLLVALLSGCWHLSLIWCAGVLVFMPFFGALRQLLEHRDINADAATDYTESAHGKVTRLFREGLIGSTFGAAGFSRHLLHHWDPQISYTRLGEVEEFVQQSNFADQLNKTTYLQTFRVLFG